MFTKERALKPMPGKIVLRKAEMRDVAVFAQWSKSKDMEQFLVGTPDMDTKELEQKIAEQIHLTNELYPSHLFLVIEKKDDGHPIGAVILREMDWKNKHVAIEVIIGDETARRQGYGGESFYAAVEYAFWELNVHKAFCYVYAFNDASLKLVRMFGAHQDVVLRKSVFRNGAFHDNIVFSLLDREFPKLARKAGTAKKLGL